MFMGGKGGVYVLENIGPHEVARLTAQQPQDIAQARCDHTATTQKTTDGFIGGGGITLVATGTPPGDAKRI